MEREFEISKLINLDEILKALKTDKTNRTQSVNLDIRDLMFYRCGRRLQEARNKISEIRSKRKLQQEFMGYIEERELLKDKWSEKDHILNAYVSIVYKKEYWYEISTKSSNKSARKANESIVNNNMFESVVEHMNGYINDKFPNYNMDKPAEFLRSLFLTAYTSGYFDCSESHFGRQENELRDMKIKHAIENTPNLSSNEINSLHFRRVFNAGVFTDT